LQEVHDTLKEHGAVLVAITPQLAEHSLKMIERHSLSFDLLSDPGSAYTASLGLTFELPEAVREIYRGFGNELPVHNGDGGWTLPMPARLVVDSGGIIRAADIDPDYTSRPEPQKTIDDVIALK
jgi:peroxiredoxin